MILIQDAIKGREERANNQIIKSISKLAGTDLYVRSNQGLFCVIDGPIYLQGNRILYRYNGKYQVLDLSNNFVYQPTNDFQQPEQIPLSYQILLLIMQIGILAKTGQTLDSNKISQALSRYVRGVNQYKFEINFLTKGLSIVLKDSGTIVDVEEFIRRTAGSN
jgi:hypothetical protein